MALNITERKEHERELIRQANYDALTGLPNKSYMMLMIAERSAGPSGSRRECR